MSTSESLFMQTGAQQPGLTGNTMPSYDRGAAEKRFATLTSLQDVVVGGGSELAACNLAAAALGLSPDLFEYWKPGYPEGVTRQELPSQTADDPRFMGVQTARYSEATFEGGGYTRTALKEAARDISNPYRAAAGEYLAGFMTTERRARTVYALARVGTMMPGGVEDPTHTAVFPGDGRQWRFHGPSPDVLNAFLSRCGYREVEPSSPSPIEELIADAPEMTALARVMQAVRAFDARQEG